MAEEDMPQDPTNLLSVSAVLIHEVYISMRDAGFSRLEALYLISCVILQRSTPPPD